MPSINGHWLSVAVDERAAGTTVAHGTLGVPCTDVVARAVTSNVALPVQLKSYRPPLPMATRIASAGRNATDHRAQAGAVRDSDLWLAGESAGPVIRVA